MQIASSQYQLFAEAKELPADDFAWHFVLQSPDRSLHLDVVDQEPGAAWERLELLAVVRGLEALDQPSRVTLLTPSRYVSHGLRYGLTEWREAGWQWESFGQMTPIKHEDLWRRVDQALEFHRVSCRICRLDEAHLAPPTPEYVRQRSRPTTPARRRRQGVEAGPRMVLSKRTKVHVDDVRTPWLSIRQRLAGVLMGLGAGYRPTLGRRVLKVVAGLLTVRLRRPKVSRTAGDLRSALWHGQETGHNNARVLRNYVYCHFCPATK